jgi:hypothetical protein
VTGGGGGGGGGGVVTTNPFVGHTWFGLIGAAAVGITFNANNTFTLVDTPPGGGPQITFQGSYTLGPAPDALGGVPQTQVTLISQGNVILSGAADFVTPDRIIFTLTSQNLPGASGALPGNMTQLAAGL